MFIAVAPLLQYRCPPQWNYMSVLEFLLSTKEAIADAEAHTRAGAGAEGARQLAFLQLSVLRANGLLLELLSTAACRQGLGDDMAAMLTQELSEESEGISAPSGGDVAAAERRLLEEGLGLTPEEASAALEGPPR
eukprot:SAG11_NODE_1970_length_3983_cov_2.766478_3_plen_135_part_00